MTEGARGWTRRSRHLKTLGTPTRRGAARSGPARAAGAGAGGSGRRTEPTEARTACPCSGAINATSGERAWTLSTPGRPRRPAAVPGVAARRRCRLGRGSQAASARVCAGRSRPVSAPSGTTAQPSTPGRCQTPCHPPVAKSSPPCARPPEAAPPSPQPAQLPDAPSPPSGRWLGKWIRLVFTEPRSRGGAGRRLPRSQGRAPASAPSPAPPEGLGTKVLCTGRKHLITSTSGMGPRGPPARREGAGRKGAGAGPQVGTSSPLRLRKGWGDPWRRSVPSTRAIPGWAKGAIS